MTEPRLIERWLPIAEIGIEAVRERTPMTPFPAPNRLHVWWARRPLVAARAAVLASLLPEDADRDRFLHVLGIHGDPIAAKERITRANRTGERLGAQAYGYSRAFAYNPTKEDRAWLDANIEEQTTLLDPTAGGGSIPLEAVRLGLNTLANDLNPVAVLVEKATVEWPLAFGPALAANLVGLGDRLTSEVRRRLAGIFPEEQCAETRPDGYLWARTITCPYCEGLVPLSPNWRLAPNGTGVRLRPALGDGPGSGGRRCSFEVVHSRELQSGETVRRGSALCPYPDCGRVIDGDEVKRQAQGERMGEQLYCVVTKTRKETILKSGKRGKDRWERGYRAPRPEDDNLAEVSSLLAEKLPEWEALGVVPTEKIPDGNKTTEPLRYGARTWRDLFSPRQLLCHGTSVEVFKELAEADGLDEMDEIRKAAYGYLALTLDRLCDYNSRMSVWHSLREVMAHTFSQHDFSFKWSYAEMAPLVEGLGYDWAIGQTAKCIDELVALTVPVAQEEEGLFAESGASEGRGSPVSITCKPGDSLDHIKDGTIDAVVIDPPYYDNVMYAELSDFFYVWLKRTAGLVFPELFRRHLTDKDSEAVASPAKFRGQNGARALARNEYQVRMAAIFAECSRVLKPEGIMTVMFTHKAVGAWDALTTALIKAGFLISASWPVNTESRGSLHIRDKAAANSTVFLVCRPRDGSAAASADVYWEDVEPRVAAAVRTRVADFLEAGIRGVDLYLASFGPALEEFSRHWPLKRGTPRPSPLARRDGTAQSDTTTDPYEATPEDALEAARREVMRWRLEQLTHRKGNADLDPTTAFVVLVWDAFRAPKFAYDEALLLARAVGVDLDRDIVGRLAEKKSGDLTLWDSSTRAAHGALGAADGSRAMVDAIHHAAHLAREQSLAAARELLSGNSVDKDPRFYAALEALLEVLPVQTSFGKLPTDAVGAASDFEALNNLRRLAYSDRIDEPEQLKLWQDVA